MALPITQFITRRSAKTSEHGNRPMYTSFSTEGSVLRPSRFADNSYQKFWKWFKTSPELIGTISIPITDILGDRPFFTSAEGEKLSKSEQKNAKKFWRNNRGKETLRASLFDAFITGDGYLWTGKPSKKEISAAVKEACKKLDISVFQTKELMVKASADEDLKVTRSLDYVAASTMTIVHDQFEIKEYVQNIMAQTSRFRPEDIIHYRFLTLDGRVEGFAPVEALSAEIFLLSFVKNNMLAYQRNGGNPDKVFILPKEIAKSKNHQFLLEQLQQYKRVQNRHGSLVFTGDLEIKDLQGNPKDLEYKELALYVTSNIAFAYGIPVSRIPYLIGSSATGGDSGGLSEKGYWTKISDIQDSIEDLLNGQLFEELGWNINFTRSYKQDEVREAQTRNMAADTVLKYQEILLKNNKQITLNKTLELLDWNDEDVEKVEIPEISKEINNPLENQNRLPNSEMDKEGDNRTRANTKRNAANNNSVVNGMNNP